ncbi:MAG: acyl-ACP--UDP-N-acetylglucosamine O-acyltransferase [Nitrospinota bacterium]
MSCKIDRGAIVSPNASLGVDVIVEPFAIIKDNVSIGDRSKVGAHTIIDHSKIGNDVVIGSFSCIGGDAQVVNIADINSSVIIEDGVIIREHVVIHRSMIDGGITKIGSNSFIMSQTHIGHDCKLGREIILSSLAGLGGHVVIDDYAVIGANALFHQHTRVGMLAMVAGGALISRDVIPFFLISHVGKPVSINSVGLRRHNYSSADITNIKRAYKVLVKSKLPLPDAVTKIKSLLDSNGPIKSMLDFLQGSKRTYLIG